MKKKRPSKRQIYQTNHHREKYRYFAVHFRRDLHTEEINYIESQPSPSVYLRELILADMRRQKAA